MFVHCRCECGRCQIIDREQECFCFHVIQEISNKNAEVSECESSEMPYNCITNNPGFHTVCLNRWVLQAVWFQYRQQYGSNAFE